MTQDDLAAGLGVGTMTVSKWERALAAPTLGRLGEIGSALGVAASWLVDGDPERVPPPPADYIVPASSKRRASGRGRWADAALDHLDSAERHLAKLRDGIERGGYYVAAIDLGLAMGRLSMIPAQLQGAAERLEVEEPAPADEGAAT